MNNKELKSLIAWIKHIVKNPRKTSSVSMWVKGSEIYIDGNNVMKDDNKFHNIIVRNNFTAEINEIAVREYQYIMSQESK